MAWKGKGGTQNHHREYGRRLDAQYWRVTAMLASGAAGWRRWKCIIATTTPPTDLPDNLITLRRACHIAEHSRKLTPAEAAWKRLIDRTLGRAVN